jgi:site-specific recombinase XerD
LDLPRLLADFLFDKRIQECSPRTIRDYQDELTAFMRFVADGCVTQANQVTPFHIRAFLANLQELGRAPTTVNRAFGNLRTFSNWLVHEDYLEKSPCAKLKAPKVSHIIKPLIAPDQFQKLLSLCPANTFVGARRRAMYLLLWNSGIRLAELASLKRSDLDWEHRRIKVFGKGARERYVPFRPEAQRPLRSYLRHLQGTQRELWIGIQGRPMTYQSIGKDLGRMFQRAGLNESLQDACHIFRRTYAMQLLEDGLDVTFVQQIVGHSTLEVLRKHYLTRLDSEKALAALDRLYAKGLR